MVGPSAALQLKYNLAPIKSLNYDCSPICNMPSGHRYIREILRVDVEYVRIESLNSCKESLVCCETALAP